MILEYLSYLKQATKNYPESNELNAIISDMYFKCPEENFKLIWNNYEEQIQNIVDRLKLKKPPLIYCEETSYDVCDCGDKMIMDVQMQCPSCGKEVPACPTIIFNDLQFYGQECRFAKPAVFNPSKHYRRWVGFILGETYFIPDEVLNQCRKDLPTLPSPTLSTLSSAESGGATARREHIQNIRCSLKKIGRSDLNKHTSAIWSRVTGNNIPPVSPYVLAEGEILFIKVLTARKHIKELIHRNRIYYPYYVYKILDLLIPAEDDRSILNLIHLQSQTTLKKNDKEWKLICKEAGLKYRPSV